MPRKKYLRYEREQEGQCATNWWTHEQFGHNQGANDCMTSLFGIKNVFSNPKPIELIRGLIQIANVKDNDIVLDFFSGSATTAHSVMALNCEDYQKRHFVLVQLPEDLDKNIDSAIGKTKAQLKVSIDFLESINKSHTISEIGKERIRRVGSKILSEVEEQNKQLKLGEEEKALPDIGFKVFKLDTSNLKTWDSTPIAEDDMQLLLDRMNGMIHRVKPDRSDMDMVYEIMLKLGVPLTYSVGKIGINDKIAYTVGKDCLLFICLAENVQPEDVEAMAEYVPAKVIIARDSFADDTAMANAYYILRDRGIELKLV